VVSALTIIQILVLSFLYFYK